LWLIAPIDEISTKIMGRAIRNKPASVHKIFRNRQLMIEQFLSTLQFENRGKLEDLGLEIDPTTPKSGG